MKQERARSRDAQPTQPVQLPTHLWVRCPVRVVKPDIVTGVAPKRAGQRPGRHLRSGEEPAEGRIDPVGPHVGAAQHEEVPVEVAQRDRRRRRTGQAILEQSPRVVVERILTVERYVHEDVVADQIRLIERLPGGVQRLEDLEGVLLLQRDHDR